MAHIKRPEWLVLGAVVALSSLSVAHSEPQADPNIVGDDASCSSQRSAFDKANAVYNEDHSKTRTFLRSFYQNGSSGTVSLHDAQLKSAMDTLAACRRSVADAKRIADENAKRAAYNAQPEVRAQQIAIANANAAHNGFVNVATFTPIDWLRGIGLTPWTPIGKTDSKAFFYTFASRNYQTFVSIKTAIKGAGDDYILMEFLSGQVDCRPNSGYPAVVNMPNVESYRGDGYPMMDNYNGTPRDFVPVEHGSVLAVAVIGTCDAVRRAGGTANWAEAPGDIPKRDEADRRRSQNSSEGQADVSDPQIRSAQVAQYMAAIESAIAQRWVKPVNLPSAPCIVHVVQSPGGKVVSAAVDSSCPYDDTGRKSVENAVLRTGFLPYDGFESVFQNNLTLTFK